MRLRAHVFFLVHKSFFCDKITMTRLTGENMKISIIGIGSVGSAVATAVANTGLAHEIVLFDRDGIRARAAAEDLGHAAAFSYDIKITAVNTYRAIRGSEIVIIAAGANQKPGQTRTDLLHANADVISDISVLRQQHRRAVVYLYFRQYIPQLALPSQFYYVVSV